MKTVFEDGNPANGTKGTIVTAAFLNSLQNHNHDGLDEDGSAPRILPAGMCAYFPSTTPPAGWIKRNGALLSRSVYADLYAYALASGNMAATDGAWQKGQFSPGDGATTFRIPDGRGEFDRGWDDGAGVDSGRGIGTVQAATSIGRHVHSDGAAGTTSAIAVSVVNGDGAGPSVTGDNANYYMTAASVTNGGTNFATSVNVRTRNTALLACIKF